MKVVNPLTDGIRTSPRNILGETILRSIFIQSGKVTKSIQNIKKDVINKKRRDI